MGRPKPPPPPIGEAKPRPVRKQLVLLVSVEFHPKLEADLGAVVREMLEADGVLRVLSVHADTLNLTSDLTLDLPALVSGS